MENKDYFKWLIDDAIDLRKDIDSVTNDIVHARLNNDDEGCRKAMWKMEKVMVDTLQYLSCLVEIKDNIVDIWEVWHTLDLNASVPDSNIAYLEIIAIVDNKIIRRVNCLASLYHWLKTHAVVQGQVKWAYIKDLLPKGGG